MTPHDTSEWDIPTDALRGDRQGNGLLYTLAILGAIGLIGALMLLGWWL